MTDIRKINRVAAAMAVSNFGLLGGSVPINRVTNWKPINVRYSSAASDVCDIAGGVIETDEHESIFIEEAERWAETISKEYNGDLLLFAETYSHHKEWITTIYNM